MGLAPILALTSCSGGSDSAPTDGGTPQQDAESDASLLDPPAAYEDDDIHHLLSRTHFGVNPQEFLVVQQMGISAYVDAMLSFPTAGTTAVDQEAEVEFLYNDDDPDGLEGMFPSTTDLTRWWLHIMVNTDQPFREHLAFFWHDHFAVGSSVFGSQERHWVRNHVDLLRDQGTGNFRTLLIDMCRDDAMAKWLDQTNNDQFNINENFAREFWELFTLGVDNGYTQTDIREGSEAFTGLNIVFDADTNLSSVEFLPEDHADGTKLVFAQTIDAQHGAGDNETDDVARMVDITLEFGGVDGVGVAEFICGKLVNHYYGPDAPQELVTELAGIMRAQNWEIAPVLAALFKSTAFYSDEAKASVIRTPLESSVGFIRATGMPFEIFRLQNSLSESRMVPTQPPDVSGWVEGEELLSSVAMVEMANLAVEVIRSRSYQEDEGFDLTTLLPTGDQLAGPVIDYWSYWLGVELTTAERDILINYMDTRRASDGELIPSLFTAADPDHLEERLRGLLYILVQHPTYLLE